MPIYELHNLALQNGEFVKAMDYVGNALELGNNFYCRIHRRYRSLSELRYRL